MTTTARFVIALCLVEAGAAAAQDRAFSIPLVDLDGAKERQVVVDREHGQYLGHPTTALLEDGRTMFCVYPKGHGAGAIVLKRSGDGGLSWSSRLETPASWSTSRETPTIYRVTDAAGRKRLVLFSGLHPVRESVSEDDGSTWSELKPVGDWGGIVAMASLVELRSGAGHYLAMFHDDGRFIANAGKSTGEFTLYGTRSLDGGLSWTAPVAIFRSREIHLCEPGAVRSPDGKRIAVLLRENSRRKNSHVIVSDDEGTTWTAPREVSAALTGDRHVARYGGDGRIFVAFRDVPRKGVLSPTAGDWVGWVGTWDDVVAGRDGALRVRLKDNHDAWDCAYSGLEVLGDGTFVATTYGHWTVGEKPWILGVRFRLEELDALARTADSRPTSR